MSLTATDDRKARAEKALSEKPDGVVEAIAASADVTPAEILSLLPQGAATVVPAEEFTAIWSEMTGWGDVLLIVHTADIVAEVTGFLPEGSEGHGWFNIHGESPIAGHIKKDHCRSIAFIDRPFHGRRSCSVWFMNGDGAAMFKIFVRRDAARELDAGQLARFEALRDRYA